MFFKNKNAKKDISKNLSFSYNFAIDYINDVLSYEKSSKEKLDIVNFFMEVTRKDIQYDLLSKFLYSEMEDISISFPFPTNYFLSDSTDVNKAILVREDRIIDLCKDTIILLPWDRYKFSNTIKLLSTNGLRYLKSNHRAYYFSDVDFCFVYNGNHSIATGIIKKTGQIKAKEYDIKGLFNELTTDGLNWYKNGEKFPVGVFDFRIAIIYELARIKHKIENNDL